MRSYRYILSIADRTRDGRQLTIRLRTALTVLGVLVFTPLLIGLGARWSARVELDQLRTANAALEIENGNFRATTGELTTQIQALENALTDLGQRAALDPAQARAMQKLPAVVKEIGRASCRERG